MGCPIESLEKLEKILAESQKDWCLVILLDRENRSPAGRQMDNLLEDLDEDSGFVYDFYPYLFWFYPQRKSQSGKFLQKDEIFHARACFPRQNAWANNP